jgi:hypothetical protein
MFTLSLIVYLVIGFIVASLFARYSYDHRYMYRDGAIFTLCILFWWGFVFVAGIETWIEFIEK